MAWRSASLWYEIIFALLLRLMPALVAVLRLGKRSLCLVLLFYDCSKFPLAFCYHATTTIHSATMTSPRCIAPFLCCTNSTGMQIDCHTTSPIHNTTPTIPTQTLWPILLIGSLLVRDIVLSLHGPHPHLTHCLDWPAPMCTDHSHGDGGAEPVTNICLCK